MFDWILEALGIKRKMGRCKECRTSWDDCVASKRGWLACCWSCKHPIL